MFVLLLVIFVGFLIGMVFFIQGPPFVRSTDDSAAQMLKLIKAGRPKRTLDLGSGDGKLVMLLAEQGYVADGIELNPLLVWRSRRAIRQAGLADRATICWGSFWSYDVSRYDTVTVYGSVNIMARLEKKLRTELRPGSRIVSNYFVFPNLTPVKNLDRIHVYKL